MSGVFNKEDKKAYLECEAERARQFQVSKSNSLIENGSFNLTLTEQRIVFFLISKINPVEDEDFARYEFDLNDFCSVCGIKKYANNKYLKEVIQNLRDKSVWYEDEERQVLLSWFSACTIDKKTGKIVLEISHVMKPYLLQLKENFTSYRFGDILQFSSKYTTWFYDYFLCQLGKRRRSSVYINLPLDVIREKNNCESYVRYCDLNKRVISISFDEINTYTRLNVEIVDYVKEHRTVKEIVVKVAKKTDEEMLKMSARNKLQLI